MVDEIDQLDRLGERVQVVALPGDDGLERDPHAALGRLLDDLGEGAGGQVPRLRVRTALPAAGRDDDAVGLERGGDVHRVECVGDALLVGRRRVEAGEDEVRHPQS